MGALAPAVRPCTGGAFGNKRRSAAPAACGGVVQTSSGAEGSVIKKVEVNGVMVEMEVIPLVAVGGEKAVVRGMERLGGVMARGSSVCVAGFNEFVVPTRKPTKITSRKPNKVEIAAGVGILTTSSKTPVNPAPEILKKRLAAELDALRDLVKKAEHMSCAREACKLKLRPEAKTDDDKTPSVKKRKISPQAAEQMQMPAKGTEANKIEDNQLVVSSVVSVIKTEETGSRKSRTPPNDEDEDEFVDICGGVSPLAVQETTTVLSPLEDGEITGNTPSSSSSSSSSSESDSSSSDSDSDSDAESVDSPMSPPPPPPAVPSEEKSTEPPEQLAAVAIHKAKLQQELLEMEMAALPDESVHAWDLQRLGIAEYGRPSVMQQLGLFLNDDAPTAAGKTEQSVQISKRRSDPKIVEADGKPPLVKKRKVCALVEPMKKIQSLAGQPPSCPAPATGAVQSVKPKNVVQDVQPPAAPKAVYMPGLIYRAKL